MAFSRTTAVAGAGTVSCTGTTTVTGVGTNFAFGLVALPTGSQARVGGTITVGGVTKTIVSIQSATQLTTDTEFGTFTGSSFTVQTGIIQTGTDALYNVTAAPTGFIIKEDRGGLMRIFDVQGQDLDIQGNLTIMSWCCQLRNDGSCNNTFQVTGSVNGGEIIFMGRKSTANNAAFPYPGFDWLGTNGSKIMKLASTNANYPAKFTLIDACVRFGADWLTTYANNYSRITTQGTECWILCAKGTGTNQARIRQDNNTASIDFQATKTWVGLWLNFGVPQLSLKGYNPMDTDGPEINLASIPVATRIPLEDYNTTYVIPNYYAGAQIVLLGGAWIRLKNNLLGTNIVWMSSSASGRNVLEFSKQITIKAQDTAGNLLSDGYMYYQPVGSNVGGIRAKGGAADITFDLSQQNIPTVAGVATSEFVFAWGFTNANGNQSVYNYFCTGTTKNAERHTVYSSRYGYDKQPLLLSLAGNGDATIASTGAAPTYVHTSLPTTDKVIANAAAITGAVFNFLTKVMNISAALDPQKVYDAYQYAGNLPANLKYNDDCVIIGDRTSYTGWTANILSGGSIGSSERFKEFGAALVNIEAGGSITIPYQDVNGLRVTVTGLDPEGFGVTWFLRHRPVGGSTWSNVSGTGNTALILLTAGSYDVQVRVPGYDWKTTTFDTTLSLSLELNLAYQVSANNTPQYTMSFDAGLEATIQYDATKMAVAVENTTGAITQPGFAELYRATQRIQHIPALVWVWTQPVTANSTSQKILIPNGNPISFFLTETSTASVKVTCPVIHLSSGESADDRVKGNSAGYSIILGSPATAESAGLQSAIVSELMAKLGGTGFVVDTHSLVNVKATIDALENYDDTELAASIEALGNPVQVDDTRLDGLAQEDTLQDVKVTLEALENYDDAILQGKVDTLSANVDSLENYDDTTLIAKIDAIKTVVDSVKTTVEDKTGYSLTSAQVESIAVAVESHLLNEGDSQMLINAIVGAIGNTNIDEAVLISSIRTDLERAGGLLKTIELKVDTLEPVDLTATNQLILDLGTPLQEDDYVEPNNANIAAIKAKTDTLVNTDTSALALQSTLLEVKGTVNDIDVDFTPVLDAIDTTLKSDDPRLDNLDATVSSRATIAQVEASPVLAKEATVIALYSPPEETEDAGVSITSINPSGHIITLKNKIGAYPVNTVSKVIFEVGRLGSTVKRTISQQLTPVNTELPTLSAILAGADVVLNSKVLGITTAEQGLEAFADGVTEVVAHVVFSGSKSVTGVLGQPFVTGTGLDVYSAYEHVLIGEDLYKIDHALGTNGGTILYLTSNLKAAATSFLPVESTSDKLLVSVAAQKYLISNIGNMAKGSCSCSSTISKTQTLSTILMWKLAAEEAFSVQDYNGADKLLLNIPAYSKKGCSC